MKSKKFHLFFIIASLIVFGLVLVYWPGETPQNTLGQISEDIETTHPANDKGVHSLQEKTPARNIPTSDTSPNEKFSYSTEIDLSNSYESEWQEQFGCTMDQVLEQTNNTYPLIGPRNDVKSGCEFGMFNARSVEEAQWMQRTH